MSSSPREKKKKKRPAYGERRILEELPEIEDLEFGDCIGQGHFSHVYNGMYHGNTPVAIKVIERGSERLIATEVHLLQILQGAPHIIQLLEVIEKENTLLIFELLSGLDVDDVFDKITLRRFRFLLKSLLEALAAAHSRGIVHRDVKLGNILVAPHFRDVKLIDWGCGCEISDSMSSKAGSRQCRPPEMLLGFRDYGGSCDIWAVGVFIVFMLTGGVIPWKARTSNEALAIMSEYFGADPIRNMAQKYDLEIPEELEENLSTETRPLEDTFAQDFDEIGRAHV